MSMKTLSAPRRIYSRNDVTHVCFEGRTYGTAAVSELSLDLPVTCEKLKSDGGRARIMVTQPRKDGPALTETWRSVSVPRKARATAEALERIGVHESAPPSRNCVKSLRSSASSTTNRGRLVS